MAISNGDYYQYKRWDQFHFYELSIALNSISGINTELYFSVLWKLAELRLHLSTALISDCTLVATISSIQDSSLNQRLLSQQISAAQDVIVQYTNPLLFYSGDVLKITTSTISVTNIVGIEAIGWAVRG
jgi:hypothetical protein